MATETIEVTAGAVVLVLLGLWLTVVVATALARRTYRETVRRLEASRLRQGARALNRTLEEVCGSQAVRRARLSLPVYAASGDRRQLLALRRELRVAVEDAAASLAEARATGIPLGELPELGRQLQRVATAEEAALRALLRGNRPLPAALAAARCRVEALRAAAAELHAVAVEALAADVAPAADRLVQDIRTDAAAVRAGLATLR